MSFEADTAVMTCKTPSPAGPADQQLNKSVHEIYTLDGAKTPQLIKLIKLFFETSAMLFLVGCNEMFKHEHVAAQV